MSEVPVQRYRFVPYGGGVEELDRFAVRDRIRAGEITAETELASVQSVDDWRPAVSYPELSRYFEIAAVKPRTLSQPLRSTPARPPAEPMSKRLVSGLTYPLAGGEAFLLIGLAVMSAVPILGFLATLASTVIMVDIVRTSADGRTKMPLVDTTQAWQLVRTYLRVLFVTVVSLLPVLLFSGYALSAVLTSRMSIATAMIGMTIALAFGALYYPACLATVAVWDNILASLNPVYVLRVIRIIGADYFVVVGMWFVATFVTTLLSSPLISPFAMIPIVGGIISRFLSFWALFYVSHLLGYAVYRHASELGWE